MPAHRPIEIQFWSKVKRRRPSQCWLWQASTRGAGYGQIGINGKPKAAHRVAWELTYGPIPEGMQVCHRCDNPPCVNPKHLFLGSHDDNMRDAVVKGRRKLTVSDVITIKYLRVVSGFKLKDIAERFDIDLSYVSGIVRGLRRKQG